MLPNNVSETHAESGDPLILDEAETGPLIPFKLVCADLGIGRGGRAAAAFRYGTRGQPFIMASYGGFNPDDKLIWRTRPKHINASRKVSLAFALYRRCDARPFWVPDPSRQLDQAICPLQSLQSRPGSISSYSTRQYCPTSRPASRPPQGETGSPLTGSSAKDLPDMTPYLS
jgi:hypothetical protein